jgi:cold shock CspA family protein
MEGVITAYIEDKGFGFLCVGVKGGMPLKYYFHISDWAGTELPKPGMEVAFDELPYQDGKRPRAINIAEL